MPRILVLGGTGFVGRHVCEKLTRLGWDVTVPTRHPAHARALEVLPLVQLVQADVHDSAALARLVAGHDAVINLVAVLHGSEERFEQVHVALARRLALACLDARVLRVVHVSAMGADPQAPSRYLRSKGRGEQVLKNAGLALTLLRPSVIFGREDRFLNLFARLQRLLPVLPLAGADSLFQPVWVEDVASAIVRCLQSPATIGQTYELAGPQVLSLGRLARLSGAWAGVAQGRGRPVVGLPQPLARLQAGLMEWLPGEPLMSRDSLDSMCVPNVASGRLPGLAALGIRAASLRGTVASYLGPHSEAGQLDTLRRMAQR